MRAFALVACVLSLPPAAAWGVTLDAPPMASSGLPFAATACVAGPPGAWVDLRVVLAPEGDVPKGRYGPAFPLDASGGACRAVVVQPDDVEGAFRLVASARNKSTRVEAAQGVTFRRELPMRLRIVDVRAPPFAGVTVENAGNAPAALGNVTLSGVALPATTLAPGARVFVGARAPPDAGATLAVPLAPRGNVTLRIARLALDSFVVPALKPGEMANANGTRPMGRTAFAPRRMEVAGALVAYATPDAGAAPLVELVDSAREEVLLEGYTLTSPEVAAALGRALARGVAVRALLEGAPVGGVPPDERGVVAALAARGAEVRLLQGDAAFPARYQTLHAKTLVVDRAAVSVATENFGASSYPPAPSSGTRGYGIVLRNATLAALFADVFAADDAGWPDVRAPGEMVPPAALATRALVRGPRFEAEGAWNVTPVFAPEGSWALVAALNATTASVDAEELFAEPGSPFVDALVAAARRNVTVRLLLDGHVDEGRNRAVAEALTALAAREGLPLLARVDAAPRTLHAKMALLDGRAAYVGSMNWGAASATRNREAGLILESADVARWLEEEFEKDWKGEEGPAPAGGGREVGAPAALPALVVAFLLTRRSPSRPSRPRS